MTARDEILSRLRQKHRPSEYPVPWQTRRHFDDLVERFKKALTAVHGEVHVVATVEEGLAALNTLLEELEVRRAVVNAEEPLLSANLPERWPGVEWHIVGQNAGDLRAFCASADVGLSSAEVALAETGSIVIRSGPGHSRLATLLPPVHIALVPASKLTTDIFTWTAVRRGSLPANTVIISGPSKTGDIEQTMAIGVHGPGRFIVILVQAV